MLDPDPHRNQCESKTKINSLYKSRQAAKLHKTSKVCFHCGSDFIFFNALMLKKFDNICDSRYVWRRKIQ